MNNFTVALSQALIDFLWQGTIVALLLYVILLLLRRNSADIRYLVSCLALTVMLLLPLISIWNSYQHTKIPEYELKNIAGDSSFVTDDKPAGLSGGISERFGEWQADIHKTDYQLMFIRFWGLGVILFSFRIIIAYGHLRRLRVTAAPVNHELVTLSHRVASRIGMDRPFELVLSNISDGPGVIGWLKPVIMLPPGIVMGLSTGQLEAVLAHELAHIRRHDYLFNLLQSIVEVVLFYHPAVWWVSDQIRKERELCCDDVAVLVTRDAVEYARVLTELEKQRLVYRQPAAGMAGYSLSYRICRLLGLDQPRGRFSEFSLALTIFLGLSVVTGMLITHNSQAREPMTTQDVVTPESVTETEAGSVINIDIYKIDGRVAFNGTGQPAQKGNRDETGNLIAQADAVNSTEVITSVSPLSLSEEQIKQQLAGEWYGEQETPTSFFTVVYRFQYNDAGELVAYIVNNPDNPHTLTTKIYNFSVEGNDLVLERNVVAARKEGRFVGFRGKFTGNAIVGETSNSRWTSPLTLRKGEYVPPVYDLELSDMAKDRLRGKWRSPTGTRTVHHPRSGDEAEAKFSAHFIFEDTASGYFTGKVEFYTELQFKDPEMNEKFPRDARKRASRLRISDASLVDGKLVLDVKRFKARFEGNYSGDTITGDWIHLGPVKGVIPMNPLTLTKIQKQ